MNAMKRKAKKPKRLRVKNPEPIEKKKSKKEANRKTRKEMALPPQDLEFDLNLDNFPNDQEEKSRSSQRKTIGSFFGFGPKKTLKKTISKKKTMKKPKKKKKPKRKRGKVPEVKVSSVPLNLNRPVEVPEALKNPPPIPRFEDNSNLNLDSNLDEQKPTEIVVEEEEAEVLLQPSPQFKMPKKFSNILKKKSSKKNVEQIDIEKKKSLKKNKKSLKKKKSQKSLMSIPSVPKLKVNNDDDDVPQIEEMPMPQMIQMSKPETMKKTFRLKPNSSPSATPAIPERKTMRKSRPLPPILPGDELKPPPAPRKIKSKKFSEININVESQDQVLDDVPPMPMRVPSIKKNNSDEGLDIIKPEMFQSKKPNAAGSNMKKSNRFSRMMFGQNKSAKNLKEEFQSKDKFRMSFWTKKKVDTLPREKKVRQSLAILSKGGKLNPFNFGQSNNQSLKNKGLEDVKSQFQGVNKFRQSFWFRKNTKKKEKKAPKKAKKLNNAMQKFAGLLENTLNQTKDEPGEKEENPDIKALDVNQNLFGEGAKKADDGGIDFTKYTKMFKFGLPDGVLRQAMVRDKIADKDIDFFLDNVHTNLGALEKKPDVVDAPASNGAKSDGKIKFLDKAGMVDYSKYIKMAKNHLPEGAIIQSMGRDGLQQDNIDFFVANIEQTDLILPPTDRFPKLNKEELKGDADYSKYIKMVKLKVPEMGIKNAMKGDGLTDKNVDFLLSNVDKLDLLGASMKTQSAPTLSPGVPAFLAGISKGKTLKKANTTISAARSNPRGSNIKSKKTSEAPSMINELRVKMEKRKTRKRLGV